MDAHWFFQKLHAVWYHNRSKASANIRIQLSSVKLDDEKYLQKYERILYYLLTNFFVLENIIIFQKYVYVM